MSMSDRMLAWVLRPVWAALPFTLWPALGEALRHHSQAVRVTASAGSWAVWAVVLLATLVPHPAGLTVLRCVTPAALGCAIAAAGSGQASTIAASAAVAWAAVVATLSFLPRTGVLFVNGPAYPNERRFLLAVPGALLLGPVELTGLAVSGLPIAAALLLAARQWAAGAVTTVVAVAAVVWLGRALYGLTRRWVVFVPAGLVLHDPMALTEPVLFPKRVIDTLGPAEQGSDSLDLTIRAIGLALELRLKEKMPMTRLVGPRRRPEEGASARLLFTPTRAGAVLAEAASRQIRVAAAGVPA
jgi:hypothetical protein